MHTWLEFDSAVQVQHLALSLAVILVSDPSRLQESAVLFWPDSYDFLIHGVTRLRLVCALC